MYNKQWIHENKLLLTIYRLYNITLQNTFAHSAVGCRIHRPLLCRGVRPLNKCLRYDTKQYDAEISVMLELLGM